MDRVRNVRVAVVAAIAAATAVGVMSTPQPATAKPSNGTPGSATRESVIVVLRDQLRTQPANRTHVNARRSAAHLAQSRVLRKLTGAAPTHVINYTVGNAFSATVTVAQAAQIAANPAVASVVLNRTVQVSPAAASGTAKKAAPPAASGPATVDPAACSSDPTKPILEPEALQTINARSSDPSAKTAAALGIDGAGVKVAYIADGINPDNQGFRRIDGTSSIIDYKDFYGDGPNAPTNGAEAFGDASAISAQGNVVYDVANFSNPNVVSYPGGHCYIKIVGVAPGADVVALKAGSELLPNSAILQSIDYAVSVDHVNVINESFGANVYPDSSTRNTIQLFNDQAVKAGVTVTVSTGDAGITSTIGNPSTDPLVISAGASTDNRLYEQTGYALATAFGNGTWQDSNISSLSSAGITQDGRTIDVDAPGEADWAVCDSSGNFSGCVSYGNPGHPFADIQSFGGTSQSSPITAGVAALVIQAYRTTHSNSTPTPAVVKTIITSTAHDLGLPGDEQGSGLVDARAAVEAAFTWPGATTAPVGTGSNVALSTNQLTLEGQPGTSKTGQITVTNVGTRAQTLAASARRYALLSQSSQTTFVNKNTLPTIAYPTNGAPWAYKKVTFSIPSGADELAVTDRWLSGAAFGGPGAVVRMTLFSPGGSFATNTRPQGGANPSNYGHVTVKQPAGGTWTAVLYTPNYAGSVPAGYKGQVAVDVQTYRALPVGTVSPASVSLAPGASTNLTVKVPVPSVGGDTVDTVSIGSSGGHQVAVPIVVRALIPTSSGSGTFAGTITGGNARGNTPAQTFSYSFDVAKGQHDLDVGLKLADEPNDLLEGVLIDPSGEVQSANTNRLVNGLTRLMQNTVASPQAGRWRYVVIVQSPVTGQELTENFTGTVGFDQVKVTGFAIPATLPAGKTAKVTIGVTNQGTAPMIVQTDARLNGQQLVQLSPQFAGSTLKLPQDVEDLSQPPAYLVPPDTRRVSVSASTTVPAQVELGSPLGGIDVFGDLASAQGGSTVSTATVSETKGQVGLGLWSTYVQEIGPYGDGGAPAATSVLSASAMTKPFDTAVSTSTGDPFLVSLDAAADVGAPIVIAPGATRAIQISITPSGKSGSKVNGVLHLVTPPRGVAGLFYTTGEVVANLPYTYTIG